MKVFISWSGEKSFKVAEVLKDWIPCVIQGITPYFSSTDIDKGTRWSSDIAKELEVADFGILCVTKENLNAPWLNFEAGALSKAIDKVKVCPFLFDLKPSDISNSPILQFQMTNVDRDDVLKLFQSMNLSMGENGLSEDHLKKMFDLSWINIDKAFKVVENMQPDKSGKKQENDQLILEEMLDLLRSQQILLRNPSRFLPKEYTDSMLDFRDKDPRYQRVQVLSARILEKHRHIERNLLNSLHYLAPQEETNQDAKKELLRAIDAYITSTRHILSELGVRNMREIGIDKASIII